HRVDALVEDLLVLDGEVAADAEVVERARPSGGDHVEAGEVATCGAAIPDCHPGSLRGDRSRSSLATRRDTRLAHARSLPHGSLATRRDTRLAHARSWSVRGERVFDTLMGPCRNGSPTSNAMVSARSPTSAHHCTR